METITFQSGLFIHTLNEKEVKELHEDYNFLVEAVLSISNPEEAKMFDLYFTPEEYKEHLKEFFIKNRHGYTEEFINRIFNNNKVYEPVTNN